MQRITRVSVVAMALVAGATVPCAAQETITFEVRISDPVLTPGEVQQIEVWATVAPPAGSLVPWNTHGGTGQLGIVLGYGGATFDLRNVQNAQTGDFSTLVLNPAVFWLSGSAGKPSPEGHVLNIVAHQPNVSPLYNGTAPLLIWRADWTPRNYEPRDVTLTTLVPGPNPYAYLDIGLFGFVPDDWTPVNVPASFTVVPTSATCGVFVATTALVALRRRRRFVSED